MDSLDHSSSPSPPIFLCPKVRFSDQMDLDTYYRKENDRSLLESDHHLLPLVLSKIETATEIKMCGLCSQRKFTVTDFWCDKCDLPYHKECAESPPHIKVPYHPKHPLQHHFSDRNKLYNKCNCCGEDTEKLYYSCSICDFKLHPVCAIKSNILSINNPKRHHHTLTYFPRKNSLTCDVCGLGDEMCFIYICSQCDFFVHKSCIYFPTTIKMSRHDHRLSFTPCISLPNKDWSCGVCRERVDGNYGEYSCVLEGCNYVVHSICATRRDLWDGKELEGEPEIEYENIKTFEEIGDGIIEHFSHPNHYMRLEKKKNDIMDDQKRCQACILSISDGNIYSCTKCDFTLHEICAHLPGRLWQQMHAHPLILVVNYEGCFECLGCYHLCYGFSYVCSECDFCLDVRCALVSEPFVHELHLL